MVAGARYHKSCYRNCTRNIPGSRDQERRQRVNRIFRVELQGYEYIRTDLLQNLRIVRLSELYTLSTSFVNSQGERVMSESYYFKILG